MDAVEPFKRTSPDSMTRLKYFIFNHNAVSISLHNTISHIRLGDSST